MSAPNEGRQSPSPENQTDSQIAAPASGKDKNAAPEGTNQETHSEESSDHQKDSVLSSNPVHPLQSAADEKIAKTVT